MANEVPLPMPKMSMTMETGELLSWSIAAGVTAREVATSSPLAGVAAVAGSDPGLIASDSITGTAFGPSPDPNEKRTPIAAGGGRAKEPSVRARPCRPIRSPRCCTRWGASRQTTTPSSTMKAGLRIAAATSNLASAQSWLQPASAEGCAFALDSKAERTEDLRNYVVRRDPDGARILLKDIASVTDASAEPGTINRSNDDRRIN